uniref:P2X purinoreceptor 7 intracellular domain-containing protein n=1 Tax=Xenopus tropicalis TaxID=8364 RepID=A0A803JX27_XENTR
MEKEFSTQMEAEFVKIMAEESASKSEEEFKTQSEEESETQSEEDSETKSEESETQSEQEAENQASTSDDESFHKLLEKMRHRPDVTKAKDCFPLNPSISKKINIQIRKEHSDRSVQQSQKDDDEGVSQATSQTGRLLNDPIRVGNADWCQCGLCIPMPPSLECICCYDIPQIFERIPEDAFCVIDNPEFDTEVTNHQRLDWGYRMTSFKITKQPRNSDYMRALRKIAYRAFTIWIYTYLGFQNRKPIPSCVVREIRSKFPDPKKKIYWISTSFRLLCRGNGL